MPETIGRRITGLRERRDMTLEELAAKVGVNATTLGRIRRRLAAMCWRHWLESSRFPQITYWA